MLKNLVLPEKEKEKSGKKQNKKKLSIPHRLRSFILSLALNRFPNISTPNATFAAFS